MHSPASGKPEMDQVQELTRYPPSRTGDQRVYDRNETDIWTLGRLESNGMSEKSSACAGSTVCHGAIRPGPKDRAGIGGRGKYATPIEEVLQSAGNAARRILFLSCETSASASSRRSLIFRALEGHAS